MPSPDEQFLRALGLPEYDWLLSGPSFFRTSEVADHLGYSDQYVRDKARAGAFPGATLNPDSRIGWRIPRSGIITYLAALHRGQAGQGRGSA